MFRTYIGHLHPQPPGNSSLNTPGFVGMTMRQPYGVGAIIIPLPGALIAGNTVVLKSSEKAPLGVARVAELIHQAGFPPGVLNVISGHGTPSGSVLTHHMEVRIISFTGSTATGKLIQQAAAKSNLKMVNLEQGKKTGKLALGGGHIEGTDGFFVQPTVFLDQPEDARVMKEEIVGPVVCINTFETEHEAVPKGQRYRVWPLRPRLHARNLQGHARRQGARERIRRSKL
ncbi:hypothetical protein MCOR18_011755 [Pyricularia oryzae]|nr:hypothetical protein MCOR18_011755 [Pyricularia oryzae]KAI6522502.1 hypothetical protein MCOR05_010283 [Pyricularia oryzae]